MIKKKDLLERIENLERKVHCLECYADSIYDENEKLLYNLNVILELNPACADPMPYCSYIDALCEILKRLKNYNRAMPDYDGMISRLSDRVSKIELIKLKETENNKTKTTTKNGVKKNV